MAGKVYRLNRKPETPGERGLPKRSLQSAEVTEQGIVGDFNRYRHEAKADTLDRALLLLPWEIIQQLNSEGWPVEAGHLGEGVTTVGVDYGQFRVGQRFQLGSVEIEITEEAKPCRHLSVLTYAQGDKATRFLKVLEGRRGWYAQVVKSGPLHVGDAMHVITD